MIDGAVSEIAQRVGIGVGIVVADLQDAIEVANDQPVSLFLFELVPHQVSRERTQSDA